MKKYLLHIGAVFLMTLCTLPALAHLNGSGYYRIRNAETGKYLIISNDKFSCDSCIRIGGGATAASKDPTKSIALATEFLRSDIKLVDDSKNTTPGAIIYSKARNYYPNEYNLIGQGTSILTLTTGSYYGDVVTVRFKDIYAHINSYGSADTISINLEGEGSFLFMTQKASLGYYRLVDDNGKLDISKSSNPVDNNAKWYIESINHLNVEPDVEFNGKYYTTMYVHYPFKLGNGMKAYYITGIANDGTLSYETYSSGSTVPAGTPVILECSSAEATNNILELMTSTAPEFTTIDQSARTAPVAQQPINPSTNKLKGTYYSNTDGDVAVYSYTLHLNKIVSSSNPQKYVLDLNSSSMLGFVETTTENTNNGNMPANKAWLEQAGNFAIIRTVATPVISPAAGTYSEAQTVTITAEQGATIEYSTDGGSTWQTYTDTFTVDETTTVQARAIIPGLQPNSTGFYAPSEVVSATYTIQESNPTLTANPTSLTINENGGSFTVEGSDLGTDNAGVTRTNGAFVPSLTASTGTATNGNANWYFTPSNGSLNGTVNVAYQGRELVDQTTFNVANNVASAEPVTVTYRPDIYIVTDNGVQNNWNFQNGTQMTNNDGIYTTTFTAPADNTFILFARKLGDGVNWNTRFVFGPDSNGDWKMPDDKVTENGNIDLYDDDPIKLPYAGDYMITIDATDPDHPTFTISRALAESTLAEIESSGVVGKAYTVSDELIGVWAVNIDNTKLLWAKDQGNVSIDKRPAKTDDQTDYMVTHMKYQHYPWDGYDWDESNWAILDFSALDENPESFVGHKLTEKSVSGIYRDANDYTIKLSEAPDMANGSENTLDADDYPGYAGVHSESNYGTKYAWAYNTYIPANFNEDNLNRLVDDVIVGAQSGPNALDNMQDQQLYFMNPKFMEIAHIWGIWEDNGANGRFVMIEPSFANNQTINAWDLHGAVDVINWNYNRKDQNNYGQPHQLTKGAHDFHALIVRKSTGNKLTSDPSSGIYGIMPLDLPDNGHPTAVKELIGNRVIKSISYYNVMGMESSRPFKGINIVVTRYSDGSSTTAKVLR